MTGFFGVEFDEAFKEDQANIFTDDLWKSSCTSNPSIRPEIDLVWVLSGRSTFLRKNADLLPRAFDDYDDMYRVMKGVEIAQKVNALRARKKVEDLQAEDCVTPILYNGRLIHNEDLRTAFALGKIKYPRNLFIILPIDPENTIGQLRSFKEYITDNAHQNVAVVSSAYHIPRVSRIIGNDSPQTESETAVDHPIRNLNFFLFGVHKNERRRGIIHDIQGEASAMAQYSSSENPSIARTQSRNTFFTDADFAMRRSFHHACNPIPI